MQDGDFNPYPALWFGFITIAAFQANGDQPMVTEKG